MSSKIITNLFPRRSIELSRRSLFKRSVIGAGITLSPLLNQLTLANTGSVGRVAIFVEGNGVEPVTMLSPSARKALDEKLSSPIGDFRYWYTKYKHTSPLELSTPDLAEAKSLAALDTLANRSTVIYGLSSKISGGGHSNFHGCLSCTKTANRVPGGPTIDAVLAPVLAGQTPFEVMRAGVVNAGGTLDFGFTAYKKGKPSPVVMSPGAASNIYFGPAVNPNGFQERAQIFDVILRGIDSALKDFPSGNEREKLENYAESIEVLVGRHGRIANHSFAGLTLPELSGSKSPMVKYKEQTQLATAALIGGLTNIAVLPIGTSGEGAFDIRYEEPYNIGRHSLHHQAETKTGNGGGEFADIIHAITAEKISYMCDMARALEATPDVNGGDMLANTLLIYMPDTGERHHSSASEWPILVMGGESMGFKQGGRTVVYPGIKEDNHRQLSNFWNTVGHLSDLDLNEFGGENEDNRKAKGPLSELMA